MIHLVASRKVGWSSWLASNMLGLFLAGFPLLGLNIRVTPEGCSLRGYQRDTLMVEPLEEQASITVYTGRVSRGVAVLTGC